MNAGAVCFGHFSLPLAVEDAKPLFTPEGERRWASSSWDPIYAIPKAIEDDAAPGTVFTTESDGGIATWIQRREDGMRYATTSGRCQAARLRGTNHDLLTRNETWNTPQVVRMPDDDRFAVLKSQRVTAVRNAFAVGRTILVSDDHGWAGCWHAPAFEHGPDDGSRLRGWRHLLRE